MVIETGRLERAAFVSDKDKPYLIFTFSATRRMP